MGYTRRIELKIGTRLGLGVSGVVSKFHIGDLRISRDILVFVSGGSPDLAPVKNGTTPDQPAWFGAPWDVVGTSAALTGVRENLEKCFGRVSPRFSTFFQAFLVFSGEKSIKIHFSTSPARETSFPTPHQGLRTSKIT